MRAANKTWIIFGAAGALALAAAIVGVRAGGSGGPAPGGGQPSGTSAGPLTLSAQLDSSHVLAAGQPQRHWLMVDVDAQDVDHVTRAPLDLVIVVDRSSSMVAEGKLDNAREAVRGVLGRMKAQDRVALVSYGTHATTEAELTRVSVGVDKVRRAIDGLRASGGTNIGAGLERARDMLASGSSPGRLRRVVLLSDGKVTAGLGINGRDEQLVDLVQAMQREEITTTTMGLGLEFGEVLMTKMADHGGGNYYYIEEGRALGQTFMREFESLGATVASKAALRIAPADGVSVRRVYGFASAREGGAVVVPLSGFQARQNKSLLVELDVSGARPGTVEVADLSLAYIETSTWSPRHQSTALSMTGTSDRGAVEGGAVREVNVRREQIEAAGAYDRAMRKLEEGRTDEAARLLRERSERLKGASSTWSAPSLAEEADEASALHRKVRRLEPSSASGKGFIKDNRSRSFHMKRRRR